MISIFVRIAALLLLFLNLTAEAAKIYVQRSGSSSSIELLLDLDSDNFEKLKDSCHNIDAIFLVLHGAMVSTNHDDFEGDFLRDIQSFLLKENISIPIVAVLDLHANVSENSIINEQA